jgi:autotransporter-associated beta strand protein
MNNPLPQTIRRRAFTAALSSLGILLTGSSLHAANEAWSTNTPGPADGNFSGTNWTVATTGASTPTNAAASGDALFFDTSAITTLTNDLSGATFAGITFNSGASAYTIGGNAFTLSGALTNNSSSLQTFSNAITLGATQTITGAGNISLSGNLGGAATSLTKSGTGTLSLSGTTNAITGNLLLSAGRLNVTAGTTNFAGAFSKLADTASTTAIAVTDSGTTLGWTGANGGNLGGAAGASGVLYNAGTFNVTATTANSAGIYISDAATAYGYLRNTGTATIAGRLWISTNTGAGVLDVAGGTVTVSGTGTGTTAATSPFRTSVGASSSSGVNITNGGTFALGKSAAQYQLNVNNSAVYNTINISGSGSKLTTVGAAGFNMNGGGNTGAVNTITLHSGGELDTSYLYRTTGGTNVFTFNGGTYKVTARDAGGIIQAGITAVVEAGGATIDTNGFGTTVAPVLLPVALTAPTGQGIDSISLSGTTTGYVGAPVVKITGGGGTGAAAIAVFDPATGQVTAITVTARGSGYTSAPTITLVGGNGGSTGSATGTATASTTISAVSSDGGLTKTGMGVLSLNAANTYTGATTVSAGTLALGASGSLASTAYSIADGATFNTAALSSYSLASVATTVGVGATTAGFFNGPTGALTLGNSLTLNFSTASITNGQTYNLFDFGSQTGDFSSVSLTGSIVGSLLLTSTDTWTRSISGYDFTFDETSGVLSVATSAIPEPATYAALCGAFILGVAAIRRRRQTTA